MSQSHRLPEHTALADELARFIDTEVSTGDEPVRPETDLVLTGLVDSLGLVRIVAWLQHRLGVDIDPGDVVIEHFGSVSAMVDYVGGRADVELG